MWPRLASSIQTTRAMYRTFLFMPLAAVFQGGSTPQVLAQEQEKERKVRIEIVTTENGQTKRVTHEFDAGDEEEMQRAMRELGIMDHLRLDGDDRDMEIDIRRFGGPEGMEELNLLLAPLPPIAPMPPLAPMGEPKGHLGVSTSALTTEQAKANKIPGGKGAYITDVLDGTPAAELGLEQGDVIVKVEDTPVTGPGALRDVVTSHEAGDKVNVTWYRAGKKMTGTATLAPSTPLGHAFDNTPEHGSEAWYLENYFGDAQDMEPRAFLGVTPGTEERGAGAWIGSVEDGTTAETMGIHAGDRITKVNDVVIEDFDMLSRTIRAMEPGEAVIITLERDGKELTVNGTLGQRDFDHVITLDPSGMDRDEGLPSEERDALRREMDELRREMDRMRRDMSQDLRVETRIRIERHPLSVEEKALLKKKGVTTLDNALKMDDLRVFPNPSNGFFRVQFDVAEKGELHVRVHDATGEKVYEERIAGTMGRYERTLDLRDKAPGTYFLVVEQGEKSHAEKLVKE